MFLSRYYPVLLYVNKFIFELLTWHTFASLLHVQALTSGLCAANLLRSNNIQKYVIHSLCDYVVPFFCGVEWHTFISKVCVNVRRNAMQ